MKLGNARRQGRYQKGKLGLGDRLVSNGPSKYQSSPRTSLTDRLVTARQTEGVHRQVIADGTSQLEGNIVLRQCATIVSPRGGLPNVMGVPGDVHEACRRIRRGHGWSK